MARTRMVCRDTREPASTTADLCGDRRRRTSAVIWSALFTAVQVWALLVVLVLVHPPGVAHVALACVMAGAVMAVILAWEKCGPDHGSPPGQLDQTDQRGPQGHDTVRLRGRSKR